MGGLDIDAVTDVSTDRAGNVLVAGTVGTTTDILLAKYTFDGRQLWQKTLGGNSWDLPFEIAANDSGDIFVAGRTSSSDFPVTAGAARTEPGSGFVIKLNPAGEILWSTYLDTAVESLALEPDDSVLVVGAERLFRVERAGTAVEELRTMVKRPTVVRTDASGNVFVAGIVMADETPVTSGAYASPRRAGRCDSTAWGAGALSPGQVDIQIARLHRRSLETAFSALLGGECGSRPASMAVTPDGRVTVGFVTQSQAFDLRAPVATAGFCRPYDLGTGVAQLSSDGSELIRSTMLGGCSAIDVAAMESAILAASDNTGGGLVVQIDDSVSAGPRIDRVSNAFSGTGFGVSPGELVSLHGAELGPLTAADLGLNPENRLPLDLEGASVLFNGQPAPLMRADANQVIFAVPFQIVGAAATVQVQRGGATSNSVLVPVVAAAPALLAAGFPSRGPETEPIAIARNAADGTLNGPMNPAKAGSTVWVFATGLGATSMAMEAGEIARSETVRPEALFREIAEVPFWYVPFETPPAPTGIRTMPGFLNSLFAVPIVAREWPENTGQQIVRITAAQYMRGTARRSFSPAVKIYVCKTDIRGNCLPQ